MSEIQDVMEQPTTSGPMEVKSAQALELGLEVQEVPTTEDGIRRFSFDSEFPSRQMWQVIARCTQGMIKSGCKISPKSFQNVFNILESLDSLENISPEMDRDLKIRNLLQSILGETPRPTKPYEYPEGLQRNAALILGRMDGELGAEQSPERDTSMPPQSTLPGARKRRHETSRSALPAPLQIEDPKVRDVMRGIIISDVGRRTYKLDPNSRPPPRDCNVIGHNGLSVGQWWPLRICAIRDGAHGAMMAGIAGGANVGAFSIVVSSIIPTSFARTCTDSFGGDYADLDKDYGNTLYYSGSNSQSNTDPSNPIITYATKAMRLSYTERRQVRVLRSGKSTGEFAPSKGLRYDGLYSITREDIEKNTKGGAYLRFKLVRDPNQPEIDVARPNTRERQVFEALKEV